MRRIECEVGMPLNTRWRTMTTQQTGNKAASYMGLIAQLRGVAGLPAVAEERLDAA